MLKRISSLVLLLILCAAPVLTEPWGGRVITLSNTTATRLVANHIRASSISFQMDVSTTGFGYVMYAPIDVTCVYQGAGTVLLFKLQPGTATAIGGNGVVPSNSDPQGGLDVSGYCVQGSVNSEAMITSWNLRN